MHDAHPVLQLFFLPSRVPPRFPTPQESDQGIYNLEGLKAKEKRAEQLHIGGGSCAVAWRKNAAHSAQVALFPSSGDFYTAPSLGLREFSYVHVGLRTAFEPASRWN